MSTGEEPRRSLVEEAAELVEAVKVWSASPEVRAQLATAASSLLEAGATLLETVAERQRAGQEPTAAPGSPPAADEPAPDEQ